ncbi:MAG: hypothetical protein SNF33_07065 [Candidatus Algichlamydia australiensis]|nr:hypothetical protein [Chlamydiales bacterium]
MCIEVVDGDVEDGSFIVGDIEDEELSDVSLIFCNGIANTRSDAIRKAGYISEEFRGKHVFCRYNPTELLSWIITRFWSSLNRLKETKNDESNAIVQNLADRIFKELQKENKRVLLIAHSHGVFIANRALKDKRLDAVRERIEVHAFAGAKIMKSDRAGRVWNYVCGSAIISHFANWIYHKKETFEIIKELRLGRTCEEAARNVVAKRNSADGIEPLSEYEECLRKAKKYNISILPSRNWLSYRDHSLVTFLPEIRRIAQECFP